MKRCRVDLREIVDILKLNVVAGGERLGNAVRGGYAGDLLSDVMGNAKAGDVWITRQIHQNIVAVASLKDLAGVIIVNGCMPAAETVSKAKEEIVPVMIADTPAFEVAGKIYALLTEKTRQP